MRFASRIGPCLAAGAFILALSGGVARADGFFRPNHCLILPGTVVVSSSTYDKH